MRLVTLSGFLGSGKTSVLLSLAAWILSGWKGNGKRLVIIENEVGEVGVDDKLLANAGYDVKALLAGCICCSLSKDFLTTLNQVRERYNPEYVVFEPSGVAYPDRIVRGVEQYVKGVEWMRQLGIVDSQRWRKILRATPELFTNQLKGSEKILLNKCDLVAEDELTALEDCVRSINGEASIWRVCAKKNLDDEIWKGW